jgi:hypothetical protein
MAKMCSVKIKETFFFDIIRIKETVTDGSCFANFKLEDRHMDVGGFSLGNLGDTAFYLIKVQGSCQFLGKMRHWQVLYNV